MRLREEIMNDEYLIMISVQMQCPILSAFKFWMSGKVRENNYEKFKNKNVDNPTIWI